jgi:aconitate hydratase
MLKGRVVHPDVSLGIAPGSRQVMMMLAKEGLLTDLIASGARLLENACGFCIGNHQSPGDGAVSLRTSNRNFEGRSGTQNAQVYLVSPETAALAAITGEFSVPSDVDGLEYASVDMPEHFHIDDSQFVYPPEERGSVEIVRGPNIGTVPAGVPLPDALDAVAAIKVGDKVTTDHIMPAGPRLKLRSNVEKYSQYVFEHVDSGFAARAASAGDRGLWNIIVAGESYGQGSSREHAALCPMYLGVKAVIAKSIERIHLANLINFGIVPFMFETAADYDGVDAGDPLKIENLRDVIEGDGRAEVNNGRTGSSFFVRAGLSARQKDILLKGGLLNQISG